MQQFSEIFQKLNKAHGNNTLLMKNNNLETKKCVTNVRYYCYSKSA